MSVQPAAMPATKQASTTRPAPRWTTTEKLPPSQTQLHQNTKTPLEHTNPIRFIFSSSMGPQRPRKLQSRRRECRHIPPPREHSPFRQSSIRNTLCFSTHRCGTPSPPLPSLPAPHLSCSRCRLHKQAALLPPQPRTTLPLTSAAPGGI